MAEKIKIMVELGAYVPVRAHDTDAGLDIRAKRTRRIPARGCATFHTGIHVQLPHGTCGLLVSKSGLCVKNNITSTGLIDEGYSGEIVVKLFNHGRGSYIVHAGDKISQLVVVPVMYETEFVNFVEGGSRGENGFGSSGK